MTSLNCGCLLILACTRHGHCTSGTIQKKSAGSIDPVSVLNHCLSEVSVDEYYRSYCSVDRVGYYVLSLFIELISSVRVCCAQEFVCHGLHTLYVFITIQPSVVEEEVGE